MKLIYLTVDGRAKIENARITTRMIEMPDGYHPVTNDSVWQDSKRTRAPILILVQGVLGAYGAHMTEEDTLGLLYEIDVAEKAFKPQSVSRMWTRLLSQVGNWLLKYGVMLGVALVAIYLVINQIVAGGM